MSPSLVQCRLSLWNSLSSIPTTEELKETKAQLIIITTKYIICTGTVLTVQDIKSNNSIVL